MRVLVISDTHIPDHARELPATIRRELSRSDLVLHAGDVTSAALLDELASYAPVHVALGNNDGEEVAAWGALPEVRLELEGVRLAMIHDSGPSKGRPARLRRRFPDADLVVFGHSHIPMWVAADGMRMLNPGSPTWKRREPRATYAVVTLSEGRTRARIVPLP